MIIHATVGITQNEDICYKTRVKSYLEILKYMPNTFISVINLSMRMCGPREALFHALIR